MVGLIQKLLCDMIQSMGGEETLNKIKMDAGIEPERVFHINQVYSDEEWQRLLASTLKILNVTEEQANDVYADYFAKDALKRFPNWFAMCDNSYEFLLIQPTIHNCFATAVTEADGELRKELCKGINDKFHVDKEPMKVVTHYRSPNQLCSLYTALARWMIAHYQDEATIEEKKCTKRGDDECEIVIQWTKFNNVKT
ncbi:MAG: hypothetical protein HKM04_02890 [Legionellales bacterium]|nr:hypothetical protein [Legionellales bacterium]